MAKIMVLVTGIIVGIYIDQTYKLPNLNNWIKKFKNDLQKYEKPN